MPLALLPPGTFVLLAIILCVANRRITTEGRVDRSTLLPLCTALISVSAIVLPLMATVHVDLLAIPGVARARSLILGGIAVDGLAIAIGVWLAISLATRPLSTNHTFLLLNLQFTSLLVSLAAVAAGLSQTACVTSSPLMPADRTGVLVSRALPQLGVSTEHILQTWGAPAAANPGWLFYQAEGQDIFFCFVDRRLTSIHQEGLRDGDFESPCNH